jgi:hypothetical protein
MPKKFIINDDDGKQFEVTEETVDEEPETETKAKPEVHDDEGLTPDEVAALKELAKHSTDLINLLNVEKEEHEATSEDSDEGVGEDIDTQDEDVCPNCGKPKDECTCDEDEDKDEVIETKAGDSKKSVGSIAKKVNKVSDSADDREIAIANAWADRYKKSYKKGE